MHYLNSAKYDRTNCVHPFQGAETTFSRLALGALTTPYIRAVSLWKLNAPRISRMIYCKRTNSTFNLSLILAGERTVKFQLDKPGGLPPDARIAFKVKTNNYYRFSIVPNTGYLPCEVTGTFLIRKKISCHSFRHRINIFSIPVSIKPRPHRARAK